MHADITAVTIQSNKIVSNEVKDNQVKRNLLANPILLIASSLYSAWNFFHKYVLH